MIKLSDTNSIVISSGVIAANGDYTSEVFDCRGLKGDFSLQWLVTGDGTVKFEALISNDGENFLDIDADIAAAQTKTTGPASDGHNMAGFTITVCNFFKIKITEANVDTATVVARLRAN